MAGIHEGFVPNEPQVPGSPRTPRLEDLLAAFARTREAGVLGEVFAVAHNPLWHVAHAVTHDGSLADDAVQDVFVDLLRLGTRYDPSRPALPWLAGMVRRKALKARHAARRRPDPGRLERPVEASEPRADAQAAFEAIGRSADPYRSAALLRWRYGLAPDEIARLRAEPPGTTRSLLSRGLAQLRHIASTLAALVGLGVAGRLASSSARGSLRLLHGLVRGQASLGTGGASGAFGSTAAAALAGVAGFWVTAAALPSVHAHAAAGSDEPLVVERRLPESWSMIHRHLPPGETPLGREPHGEDPGVDPTR